MQLRLLGLHTRDFYATFCEQFHSKRWPFFCTMYTLQFFHSSLLMIRRRGKIKLIESHFLRWIARNMNAALSDPGCSTPNIYTRHCDFMWTSCLFSAKTCGENIAAEHTNAAPFISMRSASAESSADTCGINRIKIFFARITCIVPHSSFFYLASFSLQYSKIWKWKLLLKVYLS